MIDVHGVVFQHIFPEDEDFDSLLMYWPGNTTQENHILVLAKRSKQRSGRKSSVYLSQNYGKNWTKIDDKLTTKDGRPATIDHIYTSKMQAKLVSCFILSWIVLHIFCTTFYSWRLLYFGVIKRRACELYSGRLGQVRSSFFESRSCFKLFSALHVVQFAPNYSWRYFQIVWIWLLVQWSVAAPTSNRMYKIGAIMGVVAAFT